MDLVPNSSGIDAPSLPIPDGACDSHIHIYTPGYEYSGEFIERADVGDYQKLQARLGISSAVVVNPRIYGLNNDCTIEAIKKLGIDKTRGVAVIDSNISDKELERLHLGGIRGVRFTLYTLENAPTSFDMVEEVANRIQGLGWHLQLHWTPDQIVKYRDMLEEINCPIVFDHLGRISAAQYKSHAAYQLIMDLLKHGNAWMKLSGAYLNSEMVGQNYSDMNEIARSYVQAAPNRLVWGSDWPHPTERTPKEKPNDAQLLNLLKDWAPTSELQKMILVDNPNNLYFFE